MKAITLRNNKKMAMEKEMREVEKEQVMEKEKIMVRKRRFGDHQFRSINPESHIPTKVKKD